MLLIVNVNLRTNLPTTSAWYLSRVMGLHNVCILVTNLVYGIVHDLVVQVSIYVAKYQNVIGFHAQQTFEQSATSYTIHIDMVAKFLKEYFDKTPITGDSLLTLLDNNRNSGHPLLGGGD